MHNIGSVDSVAVILFLAGQKRYATPNAAFVLHGASYTLNSTYKIPDLKEIVSIMETIEIRMRDTIVLETKLTPEEVTGLFYQGEAKTVNFALTKAMIHEIKEAVVVAEAIHYVMNFG